MAWEQGYTVTVVSHGYSSSGHCQLTHALPHLKNEAVAMTMGTKNYEVVIFSFSSNVLHCHDKCTSQLRMHWQKSPHEC